MSVRERDPNFDLQQHLRRLQSVQSIPDAHINYLNYLKLSGFTPKVIYDIGSCVMQWTRVAHEIWPSARIIMFDAFDAAEFLYAESQFDYHIGVLSDKVKNIKFYQNDRMPGGNSYYKENDDIVFPPHKFKEYETSTLDDVVKARGFPPADLIKLDVQGSERDILTGGLHALRECEHLIVEMQNVEYNLPWIESNGFACIGYKFCDNGPDADYGFISTGLKQPKQL
jgi:FkbM family methyltransferase